MIKITITFISYIFLLLNTTLMANEDDGKLRVGLLAPFSGEYKNLGESLLLSTQLALNEIDSDNIIIISRDSGSDDKIKLNLAIQEIIDNGAKIINASFGKSYSPHSNWVHEAILYAAEKDVLFIHAAGNDGNNINLKQYPNFPNDFKEGKEIANNMITVG